MKTYLVADVHLECRAFSAAERIALRADFILWLRTVATLPDTVAIYLMGDIFDFWFEFSRSVPHDYDEVLAELRRLSALVPIHFIPGNHDQWTYGYLERECGLTVHPKISTINVAGHTVLLAHGHSLSCKSPAVRAMNRVFESRVCQWAFRHLIVPRLGLGFGFRWSASNHIKHNQQPVENNNATIDYYADRGGIEPGDEQTDWAQAYLATHPDIDLIVMGHRHRGDNRMLGRTQMMILDSFFAERAYAVLCSEPFVLSELYFQR